MNIELGLSVLSKTKTLLGLEIQTSRGIGREGDMLVSKKITDIRIGLIFFYIQLGIVTDEDSVKIPSDIHETFEKLKDELKKRSEIDL
jgi:hypothetical protein